MKQQEVFKRIGGIIKEINEQYDYLQTTNGIANDLELELLVANAHFLSDHIEILRKINIQAEKVQAAVVAPVQPPAPPEPLPETKPAAEPFYFEPVMAEEEEPEALIEAPEAHTVEFEIGNKTPSETEIATEPEEETFVPEPEPIEEPAAVEPEPETIRHELTLEDIGEDWDEEEDDETYAPLTPAEAVAEPEPQKEPIVIEPEPAVEPEPVVIAPEPTPEPKPTPAVVAPPHTQIMVEEEQVITLNQRMSAQMAPGRMSDHLSVQPITDLKSAITLNDKMLYVKDLFGGYSLAYSEAIDILNRVKTFEEAETFLKGSYATKNNWADKQVTADKFYALLQRRYL
ncbi:MAG: hypothetical protein V4592_03625 [Bacteroidota bacterium]